MNNAKSLLTVNYKHDSAHDFVSSISDNQYYFFVSNHINANNTIRPFDNEQDTLITSYQGMIFGKKINSNDANLMIKRIDWQSGTVYDIYDHTDEMLYDRKFYVCVQEGTQRDIFKCLENGSGTPSTVSPSRTNVGTGGEDFFYPVDGYRWKYMYSISDADWDKFATNDYIPVFDDPGVKSKATPGSLDVVKITSPGKGYSNYLSGTFGIADIRLNGDPKKYALSGSNTNTANGFYDACWLYISSGSGSGQYRMIESYSSNATHNFITLTEEFDTADLPQNGSVFEITPSVQIIGDGREVSSASARAIIDSASGNTVSRIEMISRGEGYYHASASVMASASVGVKSQVGLVPIISPYNGHGYSSEKELGGKFAGLSVKLIGNESNTIIVDNDYSQVGILKNPTFRNVKLTLTNQNRDFDSNEWVYKVETSQLNGTVQTTLNANLALTASITTSINAHSITRVGDTILIEDGLNYQLANVVSVSNTGLVMDSAALWDTGTGTANIHLASTSSVGLIDGFATGSVILTDTLGSFSVGDIIIGSETGTHAEILTVENNGITKGFSTFIQAYTYIGSMTQGTFIPDELIYQMDNVNVVARYHSTTPDQDTGTLRIYATNQIGVFNTSSDDINTSDEIKGDSSGAIAQLTNKYLPDLVYGSGEVVYIEYGDSISRALEKTETFKFVFAF